MAPFCSRSKVLVIALTFFDANGGGRDIKGKSPSSQRRVPVGFYKRAGCTDFARRAHMASLSLGYVSPGYVSALHSVACAPVSVCQRDTPLQWAGQQPPGRSTSLAARRRPACLHHAESTNLWQHCCGRTYHGTHHTKSQGKSSALEVRSPKRLNPHKISSQQETRSSRLTTASLDSLEHSTICRSLLRRYICLRRCLWIGSPGDGTNDPLAEDVTFWRATGCFPDPMW